MLKVLNERELCDYECLVTDIFHPLSTYMTQMQYRSCLESMMIDSSNVFPIPIVLVMPSKIEIGEIITLTDNTGRIYGTLIVSECWQPDIHKEWMNVFGTTDNNHPYIYWFESTYDCSNLWYVSGTITNVAKQFHENYSKYRVSPAQSRERFEGKQLIGFQTRNPLHRSHIELIMRAAKTLKDDTNILLHPVEGVTQDCDIPFPVRMQCYKRVLPHIDNVSLAILPLNMRMAGPREAVLHAVIRRNYGCTHFIVGRDHAGPSYRKKDGASFYGPLDAQRLASSLSDKIGINIIASQELVYCEDIDTYLPVDEAVGHTVKQISGTELRKRLSSKLSVPNWFSYTSVVDVLKEYYERKPGLCIYLVGLSGSGKSTIAEGVKGLLEEEYPNRPITLLDADVIRTHLSKGLGFSKEDRSLNVRRIGYVCSEIVKHGGVVIVANIAPYRDDREFNKRLISSYGKYMEFYVNTPLEECERRDVKGLYAAARSGKITNFTGISDPFEEPTSDEAIVLRLDTKENTIQRVYHAVFSFF